MLPGQLVFVLALISQNFTAKRHVQNGFDLWHSGISVDSGGFLAGMGTMELRTRSVNRRQVALWRIKKICTSVTLAHKHTGTEGTRSNIARRRTVSWRRSGYRDNRGRGYKGEAPNGGGLVEL